MAKLTLSDIQHVVIEETCGETKITVVTDTPGNPDCWRYTMRGRLRMDHGPMTAEERDRLVGGVR